MSITTGMMSSKTDDWATPLELFDELSARYGPFDLDVCASESNAKVAHYYTKNDDGLSRVWSGRCWMNPPYGREIGKWMQKAYDEVAYGLADIVVCLVPARTDTAWWHDWAMRGEVTFLRGRVRFSGAKQSAPFPSAVVVFRAPIENPV